MNNSNKLILINFKFTSNNIFAYRSIATNVGRFTAFINIHANCVLRFKSILTETLAIDTLGIVCTIKVALTQNIHVRLLAGDFGVWFSDVALQALAIVTWC
jgi:hypothetical protein